jgi:hypothetical protein
MPPRLCGEQPRHCTGANAAAKTLAAARPAGPADWAGPRNGLIASGRRERGGWMA